MGACLVATVLFGTVADVRTGEQQRPGWSGPVDSIRVAQQMLEAFFPELKGHKYPMLIAHDEFFDRTALSERALTSFDIAVEESEAAIGHMTTDTVGQHLLVGKWEFTRSGDLDFMFLEGRANHYVEHQALLDEMIEHPTWSPTQVRAAFAGRGVHLWPENEREFLKIARPAVEKMAASFGGVARNMHTVFELGVQRPGPPVPPADPIAELDWRVDVEIVPLLPGRLTAKYALTFEPIGGKLQDIIKVDP